MATFTYTAIDRTGKRTEGTLDASDRRAAQVLLEKSGRIPVSIKEGAAPKAAASGTKWAIVECETRRNTFADVEASAAYLKSI